MKTKIIVKPIKGKGRGVFALCPFKKGEEIEVCQAILYQKKEQKYIEQTRLFHYYFEHNKKYNAIVLGNGSLYNHSDEPNAAWKTKNGSVVFYAIRDIKQSEEITHNYNDPGRVKKFKENSKYLNK